MRLNQQYPNTRILFWNVGLWQKFPDCFPLYLAVRYKIASSDEMKNNFVAVLKKMLERLTLYICSDAQNSNLVANKCKCNEESIS